MLPFLEVEHLPSSSSFYSAIIQPLGLRYLSTEDRHFPSITYGDPSRSAPVFQIRQVVSSRDRPLRTSRIVLSAPSPAAADDAYEFALRANPDVSRDAHPRHFSDGFAAASGASARRTATSGGETRVLITDFDGNLMEIVYQPPADYPSNYRGSTVRYTRSTTDEASRILDWNYDVAFSSRPSPAGPGSASGASPRTVSRRPYSRYSEDGDEPKPGLRRSVTAGSSVYEPATSARENSNGLSAGAVVGTLLGVAAGAALGGAFTYNVFKSEKSRAPREEADMSSFARRSTFPSKYDGYSGRKTRYVDVEREVEKVWHQSDYPAPSDYRRPPPEYIARYSIVDAPRSRDADDRYDDARGRQPFSRSRASSARPRSESASYREPYGGGEAEHRSYASSRSSRHPPIVQRSYTYDSPDRDTYVSARSRRSSSTVRAPPPPPAADPFAPLPHVSSHSRSASRVITTTTTTTTIKGGGSPRVYSREGSYISARNVPLPESRAPTYISARDVPLPPSRPSTYVSARHVPLPDSRVGSSHARWDDAVGDDVDDDADSIAPSDSISCVGSRRSGRSRY